MTTIAVEAAKDTTPLGGKAYWHVNERGQLVSETPVWRAIEATRLLRKIGLIGLEPTELEMSYPDL